MRLKNSNAFLILFCSLAATSAQAYGLFDRAVPVGVHGVNYSDQTFSYVIRDPNDESNAAGGEIVGRYAAGGTMCCFSLPKSWKPTLPVVVEITRWPKSTNGEDTAPIRERLEVSIPEYKEPGELWVLRLADGVIKVVSSNVGPTHDRWPGPVKGWPTPSVEFRRELWAREYENAKSSLKRSRQSHDSLLNDTEKKAQSAWETYSLHQPKWLEGYTGPQDPRFRAMLLKESTQRVKENEAKLEYLNSNKP